MYKNYRKAQCTKAVVFFDRLFFSVKVLRRDLKNKTQDLQTFNNYPAKSRDVPPSTQQNSSDIPQAWQDNSFTLERDW